MKDEVELKIEAAIWFYFTYILHPYRSTRLKEVRIWISVGPEVATSSIRPIQRNSKGYHLFLKIALSQLSYRYAVVLRTAKEMRANKTNHLIGRLATRHWDVYVVVGTIYVSWVEICTRSGLRFPWAVHNDNRSVEFGKSLIHMIIIGPFMRVYCILIRKACEMDTP